MIKPGIYKHYKNGKNYQVIDVGIHKEGNNTSEQVIYKPLYECEHRFFTRSVEQFEEKFELEQEIPVTIFDLFDIRKLRMGEKDVLVWKLNPNKLPRYKRNEIITQIKHQLTKVDSRFKNQMIFVLDESIEFEVEKGE